MNMNYTQTFNDFASSLGPTDIALYAGLAMVVWVLFKDKLNPVTVAISKALSKVTDTISSGDKLPVVASVVSKPVDQDVFFKLVASWKQTRDLAVKSGCSEAVKVADQMFPFLSPSVCKSEKDSI